MTTRNADWDTGVQVLPLIGWHHWLGLTTDLDTLVNIIHTIKRATPVTWTHHGLRYTVDMDSLLMGYSVISDTALTEVHCRPLLRREPLIWPHTADTPLTGTHCWLGYSIEWDTPVNEIHHQIHYHTSLKLCTVDRERPLTGVLCRPLLRRRHHWPRYTAAWEI